ncbi:MAG: putative addiction module component [Candidatus Hydrogenedentes bacterium ADurb.Bin101]|nr:MAG: putative addiction module component [Candidatus Hydrogenedentes bacterium ADurb.Bin101]
MTSTLDALLEEILNLPQTLRAYVAEQLLESLDMDMDATLSQAWRDTLIRRAKEVEEGLVTLQASDQVFKDAYKALE